MLSVRLNLALEQGMIALPESGRIAVFGVRSGEPLTGLPKDKVDVIARHYPDYRYFVSLGFNVAFDPVGPYDLSIVTLPRAKDEARQLLSEAARVSCGLVIIDGQKTDGVDAILKEARKLGDVRDVLSKAHGKIAVVVDPDFSSWGDVRKNSVAQGFQTAPGVFSADGIDPGSALLAEALPPALKGRVVDLGAGWGVLTDAVLKREGVTSVELVESDRIAVDLARKNVDDQRAVFHWADATTFVPEEAADHVVTNPPFHTGRTSDPALGQAFIRQAARILKPRGTLWLVANRHLPYEAVLKDAFATVRVIDETPSYKLFKASNPRRSRKG